MTLLESRVMPTRVAAGPQSVVEELARVITSILPAGQALSGIGSPGPINLQTGVLGFAPQLPRLG